MNTQNQESMRERIRWHIILKPIIVEDMYLPIIYLFVIEKIPSSCGILIIFIVIYDLSNFFLFSRGSFLIIFEYRRTSRILQANVIFSLHLQRSDISVACMYFNIACRKNALLMLCMLCVSVRNELVKLRSVCLVVFSSVFQILDLRINCWANLHLYEYSSNSNSKLLTRLIFLRGLKQN